VPFGERQRPVPKTPPLPTSKGWPRFSTRLLTPDGRARREIENILNALDARRARKLGEFTLALESGSTDKRGWARRVGVHQANKLLARRLARERASDNILCYLDNGFDAVTVQQQDKQRLVDTIDDTAQALPKLVFEVLELLLNARESDDSLALTENVLVWLAEKYGIQTAALRDWLAREMSVFHKPLRLWSVGRSGGWLPTPLPAPRSVATDAYAMLHAQGGSARNGRPADHDPWVVTWALLLAEGIAHRLDNEDPPLTLAAIVGTLRDEVPADLVAGGLHRAAAAEIEVFRTYARNHRLKPPALPPLAAVDDIVAKVGFGRQSAAKPLCFEIAALAYGLPRKALDATVKKAAK
jgi:hypothetical protein